MAKNIFNSVQYPTVGSNTFDLSHDVKMSFQMGRLYPTMCMDVIPGDRIRVSTETFLRFAPLIAPVMHRVNVTTHFFFVPNRLVWSNWDRWITGDLEVEHPYFTSENPFEGDTPTPFPEKSLADYMGLPTAGVGTNGQMGTERINALPFAAYALIWDEYYRDQNLQEKKDIILTDGNNTTEELYDFVIGPCLPRAWQHDYFTAALPFAQKGDAVQIPLYGFENVPVQFDFSVTTNPRFRNSLGPTHVPIGGAVTGVAAAGASQGNLQVGGVNAVYDPADSLIARTDLLEGQSADINDLRRAFRLQEWLEKNARGGTRYTESILVHFGVKSSDARLQRPEYLGGSVQRMVISEVLSTAETDVPVGQMAGHGISVGSGRQFSYRAEEHGWIIGLVNVQPVTAYQQGIDKKFSRLDRLEYYWPSFAHIGEQAVLRKEVIAASDTESVRNATFGYVPRYSEYRYMNSRVAGEFRSSLSFWHMGRIFDPMAISLNASFIEASSATTRIFAVEEFEADHIYGHIFNNVRALRKMPKYGTPTF